MDVSLVKQIGVMLLILTVCGPNAPSEALFTP